MTKINFKDFEISINFIFGEKEFIDLDFKYCYAEIKLQNIKTKEELKRRFSLSLKDNFKKIDYEKSWKNQLENLKKNNHCALLTFFKNTKYEYISEIWILDFRKNKAQIINGQIFIDNKAILKKYKSGITDKNIDKIILEKQNNLFFDLRCRFKSFDFKDSKIYQADIFLEKKNYFLRSLEKGFFIFRGKDGLRIEVKDSKKNYNFKSLKKNFSKNLKINFIANTTFRTCMTTVSYSKIVFNNFYQENLSCLDSWTTFDYQKQWSQGIEKIKKNKKSCLVISYQDPLWQPLLNWLLLYKEDDKVFIQQQLLFEKLYKNKIGKNIFTPETCYDFIPERIKPKEGEENQPLEWVIDLANI